VVAGLPNRDIANRLFLSARTVDHHVSALLGKLGVGRRGDAADAAARLGIDLQNGHSAAPNQAAATDAPAGRRADASLHRSQRDRASVEIAPACRATDR
jgi:hypothetical protein